MEFTPQDTAQDLHIVEMVPEYQGMVIPLCLLNEFPCIMDLDGQGVSTERRILAGQDLARKCHNPLQIPMGSCQRDLDAGGNFGKGGYAFPPVVISERVRQGLLIKSGHAGGEDTMGHLDHIALRIGTHNVAQKRRLPAQTAQQEHGQEPRDVHLTTTGDALISQM